jgi:hypothetical protein
MPNVEREDIPDAVLDAIHKCLDRIEKRLDKLERLLREADDAKR